MNPLVRRAYTEAVAIANREAPPGMRLVAIGWSTVDMDRAEADFGLEFEDAGPDEALGARCRIARDAPGAVLVLLEPVTEGRLTASLARLDEGPAITWFAPIRAAEDAATGALGDAVTAPPTSGPFGPERRWRATAHPGRHRFLLSPPPGTIAP